MRLATDPIERPQNPFAILSKLTVKHWLVFAASFLGWTLDAMDYFVFNLAVSNIATEFKENKSTITSGITLCLLLRPVGALIFGLLGDRFGRRGPLMLDILLFSILEVCTGFSNNLTTMFIIRALFGICLGGEWGLGAALALEEIPVEARGILSGLLQQGYATGNLVASGLYYAVVPSLGWRPLFYICAFPALLILFIRFFVPESKASVAQIERRKASKTSFIFDLKFTFKHHWGLAIYCIVLMTAFNFLSHGSQDLYPTFIGSLGYTDSQKAVTNAISATGAICGGTIFGYFGQYLGRRRAVIVATLGAAGMIYPWAFSSTLSSLQISGFFMQFFVQGAWGVVPAYLNELSPPAVRATFPGLTYNIGNMISASSAQIESSLGEKYPTGAVDKAGAAIPNYGLTQSVLMGITTSVLLIVIAFGEEKKGRDLTVGSLEEGPIDGTRGEVVVEYKAGVGIPQADSATTIVV
ncbi:MFS general substrate transporter [Rhizoclosmatium globosum]|uniref:MFS general substrate transporter n=1 Tax=Rhizoclosmatium globosum TaxID=329046 RepID=A0A1Y2CLD2_9FUNG|nr:MFS general substrate transporter [Rhizoclosmatium globosum]|eukprot:ORY47810.1 MFS general substrate transporter [Rhizoclosmatium globosum]